MIGHKAQLDIRAKQILYLFRVARPPRIFELSKKYLGRWLHLAISDIDRVMIEFPRPGPPNIPVQFVWGEIDLQVNSTLLYLHLVSWSIQLSQTQKSPWQVRKRWYCASLARELNCPQFGLGFLSILALRFYLPPHY